MHNNVKVGNLYAQNQGVIYAFSGSANEAHISDGGVLVVSKSLGDSTNNYLKAIQENSATQIQSNNPKIELKNVNLKTGGILAGNGTLVGNINNESGIVYAGFLSNIDSLKDASTLTIDGSYTQKDTGSLHILYDGSSNTNSKLKANSYNLEGGTLVFVPTYANGSQRLQANQEITITTADNQTSVQSVAQPKEAATHNTIQPNSKSLNQVQLINTQPQDKALSAQPLAQDTLQSTNSSASHKNFKESVQDAIANKKVTVQTHSTNTLNIVFDKDSFILKVEAKENAFAPRKDSNQSLGQALSSISRKNHLPQAYDDFLGNLDANTSQEVFEQILQNMDDTSHLTSTQNLFYTQSQLTLDNLTFALSRDYLASLQPQVFLADVGMPRANTSSRVSSDVIRRYPLYNVLSRMYDQSKTQLSITPNYTKIKSKSYTSNAYAFNIQAKQTLAKVITLGGFVDIAQSSTSFTTHATSNSRVFSIGGNSIVSVREYFSIIGSLSASMGINNLSKPSLNSLSQIEGQYNSYFLNAQLGIGKNFYTRFLNFTPMLLGYYGVVQQDGFSEKGDSLFLKTYSKTSSTNYGASVGGYIGYDKLIAARIALHINAFGFYTLRFQQALSNTARFSDFKDIAFNQQIKTNNSALYFGVQARVSVKKYFAGLQLSNEIAKDYSWINAALNVGLEF